MTAREAGSPPKTTQEPTFFAAPDLAIAGYPVFPTKGKPPSVEGGFYAATTDLSQIAAWIEDGHADHDIAVPTGVVSGIVAIDADSPETFAEMEAKYGPPAFKNRRGGHWLFRHPRDGKVISKGIRKDLDRKGDGGYIVVPPSRDRVWTMDGIPSPEDLPLLPPELRGEKKNPLPEEGECVLDEEVRKKAAETIAAHVRNIENGKRHEHLRHLFGVLLRRKVPPTDAAHIVIDAWTGVGGDLAERASHEVPNTLRTTAAALEEGNATGVPSMEKITPGLYGELVGVFGWEVVATNTQTAKDQRPTHDELRDRWIVRNPHRAHGLGEWRRYEDGIWHPMAEMLVKAEISNVIEEAKPEGIKPTASTLASVTELARVKRYIADEVWDANPDILVCKNGTIDLTTGALHPHNKAHYATAAVPYTFDPDTRSKVWEERVMGDLVAANLGEEAADFLQEFAGYTLTTDCSHELALWLTGPKGGGRSTILAGLEAMLGPRAGVLSLSDVERSSFALTNLPGKTLVTATEQPAVFLRGGGVINAIISGEPLQVDRKYRDPITVIPRCKIAWAMNELPRVANTMDGIFRRVKVLELPEIPEAERDPAVKEDVKTSGAAILNWALEGLQRLRNRGRFEIPTKVRTTTEEFEAHNDVPALFVAAECTRGGDFWESSTKLYKAYKDWCLDNGHKPLSSTSVARDWKRLGFEQKRTNKGVRWEGVKITTPGFSDFHRPDGGRV
jgi:putative DNA primase/helicase